MKKHQPEFTKLCGSDTELILIRGGIRRTLHEFRMKQKGALINFPFYFFLSFLTLERGRELISVRRKCYGAKGIIELSMGRMWRGRGRPGGALLRKFSVVGTAARK